MSNSEFRQGFRPNDNSITTQTRYRLESEKWVESINAAQSKNRISDFKSDFATIGLFSTVFFSFFILIFACLTDAVKWIRQISRQHVTKKTPQQENRERMMKAWEEELNDLQNK